MTKRVCVLLSTYNGARFLEEFLKSLLSQSYRDWQLIVRDDCSEDHTRSIIEAFRKEYPEKVTLIENGSKRLGPCRSYLTLLKETEADYYFFADQDDLWHRDRICLTLEVLLEEEASLGKDMPLLFHSDLELISEDGRPLGVSFFRYHRFSFERTDLAGVLVQNKVTGSAMACNRALKMLIKKIPEHALMHDWWLYLLATCFGRVITYRKPLVYYRVHRAQATGVLPYSPWSYLKKFLLNRDSIYSVLRGMYLQTEEFLSIYETQLTPAHRKTLQEFLRLLTSSRVLRAIKFWRSPFKKEGLLRNLALFLCLLLWKKII